MDYTLVFALVTNYVLVMYAFETMRMYLPLRVDKIWFRVLVYVIVMFVSVCLAYVSWVLWLPYIVMNLAVVALFGVLLLCAFKTKNFSQALFYVGNQLMCNFGMRGIVYPLYALVVGKYLYIMTDTPSLYYGMLTIANLVVIVMYYIETHYYSVEEIKAIGEDANKRTLISIVEWIFILAAVGISNTYTMPVDSNLVAGLHLGFMLSIVLAYFLCFSFQVTSNSLEIYQDKSSFLEDQLSKQINHYNIQAEFIDSYKKQAEHTSETLTKISEQLNNNQIEDAKISVDQLMNDAQKNMIKYRSYSNHRLVDELLRDAAYTFRERLFLLEANVNVPDDLEVSDETIVDILQSLIDTGTKTLSQIPNSRVRKLLIQSMNKVDCWYIYLEISDRKVHKYTSSPNSISDDDKEYIGESFKHVCSVVEKIGGKVNMVITNNPDNIAMSVQVPLK